VPKFLGFEARLVPGHVGAYRCPGRRCLVDFGRSDGGGLGFGGILFAICVRFQGQAWQISSAEDFQ
jgi:hypothetical protein